MLKSFSLSRQSIEAWWPPRNGAAILRLALALLALANLVALYFVLRPPGGSLSDLRAALADLRTQARQRQTILQRTQLLAAKVGTGRSEDEEFLQKYFLSRRTASSTIIAELAGDAKQAGIESKESAYAYEDVDGSDDLSMMTISANFQGTYPQLVRLLSRIDKSDSLLILSSLQATPVQGSGSLNVNLKIQTFVRDSPADTGVVSQ
jgi:hypothetical protein